MKLKAYRDKRHFDVSPEPSGHDEVSPAKGSSLIYVVQKHRASQLHYDFRLEWKGTLLSWAIPKGPSLDPSVKRLAMHVEDHPVEYAGFEGVIPGGEYGGGTVMVWDSGAWKPDDGYQDSNDLLSRGELKFTLLGKKLRGSWVLVRTRGYGSRADNSWLLIKHRDKFAATEDITVKAPKSVLSNRLPRGHCQRWGRQCRTSGDGRSRATGSKLQAAPKSSSKRTATSTQKG